MCVYLEKALAGDAYMREALAVVWQHMVVEGMKLTSQNEQMQVALVGLLYGSARIYDELNRKETFRFFKRRRCALDEAWASLSRGRLRARLNGTRLRCTSGYYPSDQCINGDDCDRRAQIIGFSADYPKPRAANSAPIRRVKKVRPRITYRRSAHITASTLRAGFERSIAALRV